MRAVLLAAVGLSVCLVCLAVTIARMQVDGWTLLAGSGACVYAAGVVDARRGAR